MHYTNHNILHDSTAHHTTSLQSTTLLHSAVTTLHFTASPLDCPPTTKQIRHNNSLLFTFFRHSFVHIHCRILVDVVVSYFCSYHFSIVDAEENIRNRCNNFCIHEYGNFLSIMLLNTTDIVSEINIIIIDFFAGGYRYEYKD